MFSDVLKKHFYPSVLTSYDVILQNVCPKRISQSHASLQTDKKKERRVKTESGLSFCPTSWSIDEYSCFMFNHCRVSECVHVRLCMKVRLFVPMSVCTCVCVCVCVHALLRCKNDQMSLLLLFSNFFFVFFSFCFRDHSDPLWYYIIYY